MPGRPDQGTGSECRVEKNTEFKERQEFILELE